MANKDGQRHEPDSEQIAEMIASWPAVTVGSGRFGSTSFELAGSEIGHLHPRLADIDYPRPLRDRLIADRRTIKHHAVPRHPTATSFRIETADDVDRAIWLFRLSYLVHAAVLQRSGEAESALAALDIEDELDALEPSNAIQIAFEAAVERGDDVRG